MTNKTLKLIQDTLEDNKATNLTVLSVESLTVQFDTIVICTATSIRHAQAMADKTSQALKKISVEVPRCKGKEDDWLILDCGDQIVHIMLEEPRAFYSLEKLWCLQGMSDEQTS